MLRFYIPGILFHSQFIIFLFVMGFGFILVLVFGGGGGLEIGFFQ